MLNKSTWLEEAKTGEMQMLFFWNPDVPCTFNRLLKQQHVTAWKSKGGLEPHLTCVNGSAPTTVWGIQALLFLQAQ